MLTLTPPLIVIPAKAGIQPSADIGCRWIPAFAGMTKVVEVQEADVCSLSAGATHSAEIPAKAGIWLYLIATENQIPAFAGISQEQEAGLGARRCC